MNLFINAMLWAYSLSVLSTPSVDGEMWYVPDRIVSQSGAYAGMLTLGVEYDINPRYSTSMMVGYVPEMIGGENLWSITWKNTFALTEEPTRPYIGFGWVYSLDKDTYIKLPSQYPSKYYPATAFYFMPYIGFDVAINKKEKVYFEVASLDYYLEAKVRNYEFLTWRDVTTWGVGYKYEL